VKYTFSGILCLTPENEGQAFLKILIPPSLWQYRATTCKWMTMESYSLALKLSQVEVKGRQKLRWGEGVAGDTQKLCHTIAYIQQWKLLVTYTYTIALQSYNIFLFTPNKYLTCDGNQIVCTMETRLFMWSWLLTLQDNMLTTILALIC
jgi:hypothetical protein